MAMDEKALREIEQRRECWECGDHHTAERVLTDDVPALVAEVRRLRETIPALREQTARLVEDRLSNKTTGALLAGLIRGRAEDLDATYAAALGDAALPVCPKGHPLVRVECCPKCAEDVPAVSA